MLVAIAYALMSLFGGTDGSFAVLATQHFEDQIKVTVAEERRTLALDNLSLVIDDIADINEQMSEDAKQLEELVVVYDSKPEEFDQLFFSSLDLRMKQITKLQHDRMAMLQHITADEWQTIIRNANEIK